MTESKPIVLIDGECNLCNGFYRFISRQRGGSGFQFLSLQSKEAQDLLENLKYKGENLISVLLIQNGEIEQESDAVLSIISKLKGPIRSFLLGRIFPRTIRDTLYKWVARNRYSWFGKANTCDLDRARPKS